MDNYFTREEANLFSFFRIPKELFNEFYNHISTDAKLLYGLLLDRNSLSIKNNWVDEKERIYIYFSREEVQETFNFSNKTVVKIFRELNDCNLIEEIRQGLGKPNIIYVKKFYQSVEFALMCKNYTSGSVKNTCQEVKKIHANNTNIINTDFNKSVSQEKKPDGQTDELTIQSIINQSELYCFSDDAQKLVEASIRVVFTQNNIAYVLKMGLTQSQLKDRLKELKISHIDRAFRKYEDRKHTVENTLIYFTKVLIESIAVAGAEQPEYNEEGVENY